MSDAPSARDPATLFATLRAIQIRTRRLVTDAMSGDYTSAFKGRGVEFDEVREYRPGDDIRRIDWNVTARSGQPFVKLHREERELTVMLAVDVSRSGAFGSGEKSKSELCAEVAAVLAYSAEKSNDKVGLLLFSEDVEHFIPPKKGRAHLWRVVRDVLTYAPKKRGTRIATALEFLGRVLKRRSVVFLVSDFLDDGYELPLSLLARRHDVTAVTMRDPRELELPNVGWVELEDLETRARRLIDTSDARAMRALREAALARDAALTSALRRAGVGEIPIRSDASYVHPIERYFRSR